MRASRAAARKADREIHISGAEGLYDAIDIAAAGADYITRAVGHPKGMPDTVIITLEKLKTAPVSAPVLCVRTEDCGTPQAAWDTIVRRLSALGISVRALSSAGKILRSRRTMRGAALLSSETGERLDCDKKRGVRVSRLGIDKSSGKQLGKKLGALKTNTSKVKEALLLASKVASCKDIVAEICISDDPDYTTGYLASKSSGYVRIPNIKLDGEMHGGRVFFVRHGASIEKTVDYLEKIAVIMEYNKG